MKRQIRLRTAIIFVLVFAGVTLGLGYSIGVAHAAAASSCTLNTGIATCDAVAFNGIADSSTAGKLFLSTTTANTLKYYDIQGTPALHSIAALDLAQTFTGVQTFNAGIIFNAAGSIAATSTYIEADGVGGSMSFNVPAGKNFLFTIAQSAAFQYLATGEFDIFPTAGTLSFVFKPNFFYPVPDNSVVLGETFHRWSNAISAMWSVLHAAGDANPSAQLGDGFVKFGAGGATALSTSLTWVSGGLQFNQIFKQYNGINTAGIGVPAIYAIGAQTLYTNAAPTTLSYTPPATAGCYRFTGSLDALTAGTMTFKVKITYTDAGGNARTDVPGFYLQGGTAITAGGNTANTAGQYDMIPYSFCINNAGTAITIQDNAGTYTAGTYYWTPELEQVG